MKYILLSIATLILLSSSTLSYAGAQQNPVAVTVQSYRVQTNGSRFSVQTVGDTISINPGGCSSSSRVRSFYVVRPADEAGQVGYDQMFTSVMTAKFSGSPINIWISDEVCSSNIPVVTLIRVN